MRSVVGTAALGVVATSRVASGVDGAVSSDAIAKDPEKFRGKEVVVRSDVDRVYNNRYFTLDEDAVAAGPDVLVLVPASGRAVTEEDEVIVTGTVRDYVQTEIERDYAWFRPAPDVTATFKSRPVIVARSVRTKNGVELVTEPPPPAQRPAAAPVEAVPLPSADGGDTKGTRVP